MKARSIIMLAAGIGLLALLTACVPQPNFAAVKENYQSDPSITLPLEKKFIATGRYAVKSQVFKSGQEKYSSYKLWYPAELENGGRTYPLVIMANGTSIIYSKYEAIFEHLASRGFIVAGNDDNSSMLGESTDNTLKFALSLNDDPKSQFYHRIDTQKIGVGGHSQGGVGDVSAVVYYPNGHLYKAVFGASGGHDEAYKLKVPYFLIAGTGKVDTTLLAKPENFAKIFDGLTGNGLTVMARRKDADHGEMLYKSDGYMTAWFLYTLMNDPEAANVFTGEKPEIKQNANWQDVRLK